MIKKVSLFFSTIFILFLFLIPTINASIFEENFNGGTIGNLTSCDRPEYIENSTRVKSLYGTDNNHNICWKNLDTTYTNISLVFYQNISSVIGTKHFTIAEMHQSADPLDFIGILCSVNLDDGNTGSCNFHYQNDDSTYPTYTIIPLSWNKFEIRFSNNRSIFLFNDVELGNQSTTINTIYRIKLSVFSQGLPNFQKSQIDDIVLSNYPATNTVISCLTGWCYIGLENITPQTLSALGTLQSNSIIQGHYNSVTQKYESHRNNYNFNQNINVQQKEGYYYYFNTPTSITITPGTNPSINLVQGWNLASNYGLSARTLSALKSSIGAEATSAKYYDKSLQTWVTTDSQSVPAMEAFFVYMTSSKVWTG